MIRRLLLISMFSSIGLAAWAQSSLEGKVTDASNGEALLFANVVLFKNGNLITGTQTDLDGNYVFSSVDPGTHDVEASYTGFPTQRQTGVVILAGKAIRLDFKLDNGLLLDVIEVKAYKVPLIEQDNTTQGVSRPLNKSGIFQQKISMPSPPPPLGYPVLTVEISISAVPGATLRTTISMVSELTIQILFLSLKSSSSR